MTMFLLKREKFVTGKLRKFQNAPLKKIPNYATVKMVLTINQK
jgi:hypothetical protein